jgi:hypothetical protein
VLDPSSSSRIRRRSWAELGSDRRRLSPRRPLAIGPLVNICGTKDAVILTSATLCAGRLTTKKKAAPMAPMSSPWIAVRL